MTETSRKPEAKTLSVMPHRFTDKHQPESDGSFLNRLLVWCFQNELDGPNKWVSEAEFKRLQTENESLEKDRDNLLESLKICGKNLNTYAGWWSDQKELIKRLEGRLLAIKQHYEAFSTWKSGIMDWYQRFGVLLSQPKGEAEKKLEKP